MWNAAEELQVLRYFQVTRNSNGSLSLGENILIAVRNQRQKPYQTSRNVGVIAEIVSKESPGRKMLKSFTGYFR